MSSEDTNFQIYHSGKFVTYGEGVNRVITYEGGEVHDHVSPAASLFTDLSEAVGISLYGQRIWYKFPWEDLIDCKVLCNGSDSFQRLIQAATWTKSIDIYMEADEEEEVVNNDAAEQTENVAEEQTENVAEEQTENPNVEENGEVNEEGEDDVGTYVYEEADRVESLVGQFLSDDEDDEAYQNTPPQSDDEEEAGQKHSYPRYKRGSGVLEISQVFESVKDFRQAVLEYALKEGYNVTFGRWGGIKSEAKCGVKDETCPWRIYLSYHPSSGKWMVKTFQEEHTCFKDGNCRILTDTIIAEIFLNDVRNNKKLSPKWMQDQIHKDYDLVTTYDKCRKAKKKAQDIIQAEFDEQFSRIKDYETEILRSNPGSTTKLVTIQKDGKERLDKFYVCFAALRKVWLGYCRPIFGIDGCFLKSTSKGQLLTAVGRDSNNQIYPVAWAYVQTEDAETWKWFIKMLKKDLQLGDGFGFTLVSDRQKGLLKAVGEILPKVEHRMCARHIYGNMRGKFPKKARLKSLFWKVVESPNKAEFEASLKQLEEYDFEVYRDFKAKNPATFCRAFFQTTPCCDDALNNFSESYNSVIERARALPLIEMLETMRRQTMVRIDARKTKALKNKGKFSLKVTTAIALEEKEKKWCRTFPGPTGIFESYERGVSHTVNMRMHTCTCRRWDLTGIPCRHALRVILDRKTYHVDDLVSDWYLTTSWIQQYSDSISPLNGLKFWKKSEKPRLEAPPRDNDKGRRKNPEQRKKSIIESPKKGKKVSGHGRTMHCYRCGMPGHNSISCSNPGVPFKPRPPKKAKTNPAADSITLDCGEGPSQSQPTQPSGDQ